MFLCFLFISIFTKLCESSTSDRTALGRKLKIRKNRANIRSIESSWYFVHFFDHPNRTIFDRLSIRVTSRDRISRCWFRLFLSSEECLRLINSHLAEVSELLPEDKIVISNLPLNEASRLLLEVDESFKPELAFKHLKNVNYSRMSKNLYSLCVNDASEIANMFANVKTVGTITPNVELKFLNRYSVGRSMGSAEPTLHNGRFDAERKPYNYGYEGEGQTILILDSGIDTQSTYFYDPKVPVQFNTLMPTHRKLVYYDTSGGDQSDYFGGHGTHVSGIAAGSSLLEDGISTYYNGAAPKSKIVFMDVAKGENLFVPDPDDLYALIEKTDPKIMSCSWGVDSNQFYSEFYKIEYNQISYDNPKMLVLFAIGNSGYGKTGVQYKSTNSPGSAKNVFAVGNVQTPYTISFESEELNWNFKQSDPTFDISGIKAVNYNWSINPLRLYVNPIITDAPIVKTVDSIDSTKVYYIESDYCTNLQSAASKKPKAAILQGATSALKCTPKLEYPVFFMVDKNAKITASTVSIKPRVADGLREEMQRTSSYGPDTWGTVKPEISAVGTVILSAMGMGNQSTPNHAVLNTMAGTSMATPLVAGLSAIIREYVYKKKSLDPKASTMKALLLASVDPISGQTLYPSPQSGSGVPNLENILPFDSTMNLRIAQDVSIRALEHLVAKVKVLNKNKALRIAMSYLDPVTSTDAKIPLLIDLDLFVVSPTGKTTYGNHYPRNISEHYSTSERVRILPDELEVGEYEIHIFGDGDFSFNDFIVFSAVACGPIESGNALSFAKIAKCTGCSGFGKCDPNFICLCESGHIGKNCEIEEITLPTDVTTVVFPIEPGGTIYYNMVMPKNYKQLDFFMEPADYGPLMMLYRSFNRSEVVPGNNDEVRKVIVNSWDAMYVDKYTPDNMPPNTVVHIVLFNADSLTHNMNCGSRLILNPDVPTNPPTDTKTDTTTDTTKTTSKTDTTTDTTKTTSKTDTTTDTTKTTSKTDTTTDTTKTTSKTDTTTDTTKTTSKTDEITLTKDTQIPNPDDSADEDKKNQKDSKGGMIAGIVIGVIVLVAVVVGLLIFFIKKGNGHVPGMTKEFTLYNAEDL